MIITITKGLRELTMNVQYQAFIDGKFAGEVTLTQTNDTALTLWVVPEHRRKGVATALYTYIAKDLGNPLIAAPNRSTDEQKLFRAYFDSLTTTL
jgi:GNAT superfamily N-acetyltransferase